MKSPVLFLIFKREDTTRKVFESIRSARPPKLYIAADGPRDSHPGEKESCERTREITESIDWPCEVHRLYRDSNLGCGKGVASAITWFFENEPEGIILEDDILPHQDFFRFCDEMLEKYRDDERVMIVSGHNNFYHGYDTDSTLFLSRLGGIWGWASWRRAWKGYKYDLNEIPSGDLYSSLSTKFPKAFVKKWMKIYRRMCNQQGNDIWDYQWAIHRFMHNGLSVSSYKNMTHNIGIDHADATHTTGPNLLEANHHAVPIYPFEQAKIKEDFAADLYVIRKNNPNMFIKAFRKAKGIITRFLY